MMLTSYFWIILMMFSVPCVLVASVVILWLAHLEDERRKKRTHVSIRARERMLRSEVNSLRKKAESLRELLGAEHD
jgi:hypothetical protein